MKYYGHVWAGAPSYYLEILDRQQKWIYVTVGSSLAAFLEHFVDCQNLASLSLL